VLRKVPKKFAWFAVGGVVLAGAFALAIAMNSPSQDSVYLKNITDAGLAADFASEEEAVSWGRNVCWKIKSGEPNQGQQAESFAVEAFCSELADDFKLLKKFSVLGKVTYDESDGYISVSGESCSVGYSFTSETPISISNGDGELLDEGNLGKGEWFVSEYDTQEPYCLFRFSLKAIEGQSKYILRIGTSSLAYTEAELKGKYLTLGIN